MTHAEELYLREKYEQDPSFAYACSDDDLDKLLSLFVTLRTLHTRSRDSNVQLARRYGIITV